jgi:amidase
MSFSKGIRLAAMDEILDASAMAQAAAIRSGRVSSEELVKAHLRRIEAVNPTLNAVVQLDAEGALKGAREADGILRRGEEAGPFHGVPFTAKDWLESDGLVCAAGYEARRGYVPKRDATVVARMRAAGAILLGKTNVLEANPVYGATRNPYNVARSPGASTSGEAALIATGGSPLGLGSDSGGSLRYPAHCCGIATLKPTSGRVPLTGHFPRIGAMHDPRTVIGPLSRYVDDLWPVLAAIAGEDWRDPSVAPVPLVPGAHGVSGKRIGWFVEMPGATPSDATVAAVEAAVAALAGAGAAVERVTRPRIDEAWPLTLAYWARVQSPSWSEWEPPSEATMSADETERSIFEWDRFRRAMLAFVAEFDVIVCPVAEDSAPLHGSIAARDYVYTLPFSLTGWPVAVVRAGPSETGMPIGVQLAARPWREWDALEAAKVVEADCGGWQRPGGGDS